MSHPECLIGLRGWVARGSQPLAGVQGYPLLLFLFLAPPQAARKKGKKGFSGDTPAPPQIRDDSWLLHLI
jgi:hypothetical protein